MGNDRGSRLLLAGVAVCLPILFAIRFACAGKPAQSERDLAVFVTSLRGRNSAQRHNARQAANMLHGTVVPPNGVFSFNRVVRSWSIDQGYVRAPVSFNGELVPAFGGGVCQTSTTLYNAALLAGMMLLERHRHVYAPSYVAAGRDAAVAQPDLDLRFQNPYPTPVTILTQCEGDRLEVRIRSTSAPSREYVVRTVILGRTDAKSAVIRNALSLTRTYRRFRGSPGLRVVTFRIAVEHGQEVERLRLSDDTYPPMSNLVVLPDQGS